VKEITQPIIKAARSTKIYKKDISPHKKEITTKPQSQVEPARIQSKTVQPSRIYASATNIESSSSNVSPIHRATKERAVPSSPNQFIEEIMHEFQKELKVWTKRSRKDLKNSWTKQAN